MIRLNLLPQQYKPHRQLGSITTYTVVTGVTLAVLALSSFYMYKYMELNRLRADLSGLQGQEAAVRKQLDRAKQIGAGEKEADSQDALLKHLKGRPYSPVLLEFRELTPKNVAWTALKVTGNELNLRGKAASMHDVSQLMTALSNSPLVAGVELESTSEEQSKGYRLVLFQVVIHLVDLQEGGTGSGA